MSESGFDVLKDFQPEGGSITYEPYKPFQESQNVVDYNIERQQKNQISADAAAQMVQDTNTFNYYANMYAGQLLPVQQQQKLNMDAYAQALGLGKRYSPDDFKAIIEEAVGPIEESSAGRKFTRFMVDMFNARTPYQGTAGALDVYLQSLGKKFEREDLLKAQKLERRLMIGELAAKQAADANAAMKSVEADYYAKMMGYDNDTAQKYLGFTGDLLQKIAQTNFDIQENRAKAALDLFKNPKMPLNIGYTTEQGDFVGPIAAMPVLTDTGIQMKLGRKDEQSGRIIYDLDLPTANFRLMPKEGAEAEAKAAKASTLSQAKIREGSSNLFTLQNQYDDVQSILQIAYQDPSKVGVSGSIKKFFQEFGATTAATTDVFFDLLGQEQGKGALGTNLVSDGQMLFSYDQANPGAIPTGGTVDTTIKSDIILNDLPVYAKGVKVPFKTRDNVVTQASLDDITKTSWWEGQGYDPTYAQNKVKEIFIIYGLARALKSTGRLNVDDIQRASEAVSIYGLQSPKAAIAKLEQVSQKLSDAQKAIIRSTPEVLGTNPEVNEVIIPMLERLQLPVDVYSQYFMTPISPQGDTVREVEGAIPTTIEETGSLQSPPANTGQSMSVDELFLGGNS